VLPSARLEAVMRYAALFFLCLAAFGQQAPAPPVQDLNVLIGKQVIVQRTILCPPATLKWTLDYAGKTATVISLKPGPQTFAVRHPEKLPPQIRALWEDQQRAAIILVQFEDGTRLDSCTAISPAKLSDHFELVQGHTLEVAKAPTPTPNAILTPTPVPTLALAPATSTLSVAAAAQQVSVSPTLDLNMLVGKRVIVQQVGLCQPGTLAVSLDYAGKQATVVSLKPVDGLPMAKILVQFDDGAQLDSCMPLTVSSRSLYFELVPRPTTATSLPPGTLTPSITAAPVSSTQECPVTVVKATSTNGGFRHAFAVTVYVSRVRFEDNTFWKDNGSRSCALTSKIKQ
jgi:hypothetical protein